MERARKFLLSIGVFCILVIPGVSFAQQEGIQISPLTYNLEIKPGETKQAKIIVTNLNDTDLQYICEAEPFSGVSEEGAPDFSNTELREGVTTLADWIEFESSTKEGTINPGLEKEINFSISIPVGAEPGGHYAAVFAKQIKKNAEGKTELGVSSRVGTLILVSVPGDVSQSAQITEFNYPKFVWTGPVSFKAKVENTGTVHYDSNVKLTADPLLGSDKEVDLGTHTVLPANTRVFDGKWDNKYPFGYYKLTATATAGDGDAAVATGLLIAIPLVVVLPVLAGLILMVYLIKYVKSHVKIVK